MENRKLLVSYTKTDYRIEAFPAGGPGGQHQNRSNTAIRITHLPSGLSSVSREFRSQHQNKQEAFKKLSKMAVTWFLQTQESKKVERSKETIRTYNKVDNRVKDHDSGHQQTYTEVMDDISEMVNARLTEKLKCRININENS